MEKPREPLTTQQLIDNLFAQHDTEVHAIFARLMEIEVDGGETSEEDNRLAES